jgi:hypothetical protein
VLFRSQARRGSAVQASGIGLFGGATTAVVFTLLNLMMPLAIVAGAAVTAGAVISSRRSYRRDASLAQLALEQILDRLEFGEASKGKLFSL